MREYFDKILVDIKGQGTVPQYLEYDEPPVEKAEALRYSGYPADRAVAVASGKLEDEAVSAMVDKVFELMKGQLVLKVGYKIVPISFDEEGFPILPFEQRSEQLKGNLEGCSLAVLFAATVGSGIDRLIRRYERTEAKTALFLQGCGAERAESLTNAFNNDVKNAAELAGYKAHPRFSPGFGDLPLTVQTEFLALLDAGRRMGITLNESLLMSPSKSVTAIIGLEKL
ncbi:MAG: hypothetical protein IKO61_09835 [Lachnospiraceae bacterium]|nr:hypothetical protein [Lachnospiraceae bacterium]